MGRIVSEALRKAYEPEAEDIHLAACMRKLVAMNEGLLPATLESFRAHLRRLGLVLAVRWSSEHLAHQN